MDHHLNPIKLLITITNRGNGEQVEELLSTLGITYQTICLAHGTAHSEIIDYLGLGETEKDVVLSTVEESKVQSALNLLSQKLHFEKQGHGIAFTIPINSVGGPITLKILTGLLGKEQ